MYTGFVLLFVKFQNFFSDLLGAVCLLNFAQRTALGAQRMSLGARRTSFLLLGSLPLGLPHNPRWMLVLYTFQNWKSFTTRAGRRYQITKLSYWAETWFIGQKTWGLSTGQDLHLLSEICWVFCCWAETRITRRNFQGLPLSRNLIYWAQNLRFQCYPEMRSTRPNILGVVTRQKRDPLGRKFQVLRSTGIGQKLDLPGEYAWLGH